MKNSYAESIENAAWRIGRLEMAFGQRSLNPPLEIKSQRRFFLWRIVAKTAQTNEGKQFGPVIERFPNKRAI